MAKTDWKLGHTEMVRWLGADESTVLGGRIKLGSFGEIETSQWSGHYGGNWSLKLADKFKPYMEEMTGKAIEHTCNMHFKNGTGH